MEGEYEIVGFDLLMMSDLADMAGVTEAVLAYPNGYVLRLYLANPQVMSASPLMPHVTRLVRLPPSWEYV